MPIIDALWVFVALLVMAGLAGILTIYGVCLAGIAAWMWLMDRYFNRIIFEK